MAKNKKVIDMAKKAKRTAKKSKKGSKKRSSKPKVCEFC